MYHFKNSNKNLNCFDNAQPPGQPVFTNAPPWGRRSEKMPDKFPVGG